jgi:zinc protease
MKTLLALALALLIAPAAQAAEDRIQRVISPGGIEAWLVEEPAIPMVAVEVIFSGGARVDAEGQDGAAYLASGLIEEGAGDMDSQGFALRKEDLSARISFSSGRDEFTVGMRALSANLEESFELLHIALTEPTFEQRQIDRVRDQVLSGMKSDLVDPNTQAATEWFAQAFPGTSYGRPTKGTPETINALTRADLLDTYGRMAVTSRMKIGVVGDIDAATLGPLLDATFGDLPEGEALDTSPIDPVTVSGVHVIEADIPQSTAIFGHRGMMRDDPDFIPAFVMNHIFGGGGFGSRLTTEVREKNGLAYSVYSYLAPYERAALYMGGVATANERVAESLDLIRAEWRRMAEQGVTEAELEAAKKYLTGAFALRFDSNAKIAGYLAGLQASGISPGCSRRTSASTISTPATIW